MNLKSYFMGLKAHAPSESVYGSEGAPPQISSWTCKPMLPPNLFTGLKALPPNFFLGLKAHAPSAKCSLSRIQPVLAPHDQLAIHRGSRGLQAPDMPNPRIGPLGLGSP